MVTAGMVRQAASEHRMSVRRVDGEWRITPAELHGTRKGEDVAYYTDDNEDALLTLVSMRRVQDDINARG